MRELTPEQKARRLMALLRYSSMRMARRQKRLEMENDGVAPVSRAIFGRIAPPAAVAR